MKALSKTSRLNPKKLYMLSGLALKKLLYDKDICRKYPKSNGVMDKKHPKTNGVYEI
jgi:hypothetical protein